MTQIAEKAPDLDFETELKDRLISFAKEYFPIYRSITGEGVRESLRLIQRHIPDLKIHEVPSGKECFDWTVPEEWNIKDAYILDPDGNKICDFQKNNLHVVGYSTPIDQEVSLEELEKHLHSLPQQPNAIPYVTSYYAKNWGFCLSQEQRDGLKPGTYKVFIDSEFKQGSLSYGELYLPGKRKEEIFFSTNICHPAMANNETSGPTVLTFLGEFLSGQTDLEYSYRLIFIPETIGAVAYLDEHLDHLQKNVVAGFNVSCAGDERVYSHLHSRAQNTLADKVLSHVLSHTDPNYIRYSFLERGSDERQYCSPGVDLPVAGFTRSKYGEFPEYHTSLDTFDVVSAEGLYGSLEVLKKVVNALEANKTYRVTVKCEPQLGKRGLYPALSTKETKAIVYNMVNCLAYADGTRDLLDIAETIKCPVWELYDLIDDFLKHDLVIEE
ncbi:MAG: DUF4910 domain-containing protein [Alphaproteobacteria bacterium]|nr:DUF4910 domain-containing protein [Alphaproteobacteria bacterium]